MSCASSLAWALALLLLAPAAGAQEQASLEELLRVFGGAEDGEAGRPAQPAGLEGLVPEAEDAPAATPAPPPASPLGRAGNTGFEAISADRFDLHARNLDVAEAFTQLRQLVRRNIVVDPGVNERFTGDLYDVSAEEAIEVVCRSTNLVARDEETYIYVERAVIGTRIFQLDHARAADLLLMIEPLLSPDGTASATQPSEQGIRSSQEEAGGDAYAFAEIVVVSDFPHVLEQVAEVVSRVDAAPDQVLIEATILSAQLSDDLQMGIQFSALSGLDWNDVGGSSDNGFGVDYGPIGGDDLTDGLSAAATHVADGLSSGGLNVGFLKNGVGAFVRALSTLTETTLLANPRIVTLNKQRGEVLLGRRDGFLTTTTTQTATIQSIMYLETGTRLVFRPFISSNGMVRLEVHPEDSDGGVSADGLPFKDTAEITTNVMLRSGETVVIGGLFRERQQRTERKVPFLGSVPLLGWLFRSEVDTTIREEIIILLTPHIEGWEDERSEPLAGSPPWEFSELVDTRALAGSYLESARLLQEHDDFAAATYMVDLADVLEGGVREIRDLRRLLWLQRIPEVRVDSIDHRLTDRLLYPEELLP